MKSKEFNEKVISVILSAGFENDEELGKNRYTKMTRFGLVKIYVPEQNEWATYTIFSRFENPEMASRVFNCNRFSGKHNFHYDDAQECLGMFEFFLDQLNSYSAEE